MKKILLSFLILSCTIVNAQYANDFLSAAEKYFNKGDYFSAAQYYEKYLGGKDKKAAGFNPYAVSASVKTTSTAGMNKETVIYKLAESYRLLNFHEKAAPQYKKLLDMGNTKFTLTRYYYASSLRALGQYDEAEKEFNTFLSGYNTEDIYTENAKRELQNLAFIRGQLNKKDLSLYTINKAPQGLNSEGGNYAPVWLNNNTLLFTSTRPNVSGNKEYVNRIYQAQYENGVAGIVINAGVEQPKDIHQGVTAITPDGNVMFITRWQIANNKKTATLYSSKRSNTKWSDPAAVDALNINGSNSQQPLVMPDGKTLLFSSDRPGGLGGFDLWSATLDNNGNASAPVNMGAVLNTKYDEQAPYYHIPSSTLIFSTNGRTGMGGYDFFYSKGNMNTFSEPVNFGYPVNSIKDDLYFASRGEAKNVLDDIIISSDRDASCCLELFALNKKRPMRIIEGTVVACDTKMPLSGVSVNVVDPSTNKALTVVTTDASGKYSFSLPEYQLLKATATTTGYFTNSLRFNSPDDAEAEMLSNPPICLTVIPEVAIKVDNVYYDFNMATLKAESYPSLDSLVALLNDNPTMEIELSAHTDSKGTDEYNLKLSDARAKSVVDYLISKGISTSRLQAKGYGESAPVADNTNANGTDNPEGRQKNRRTEFKVLRN